MAMAGDLGLRVKRAARAPLWWRIRNGMRPAFWLGWLAVVVARGLTRLTGIPTLTSDVRARLIRKDGTVIDYGVLGYRVVTTAFVNFMVDQLQAETSEWGDFKFHDSGEGSTAENVTDTDIETTDGESRATGTQTEGSANQYRSVGTISYTSTKAITEHGLFSQVTGGVLLDRTVFAAINVEASDSISFTYSLTCNSGG
jgi:hypothetical protein